VSEESDRLVARVAEFEEIIRAARMAQHKDLPPEIAEHFESTDPVLTWNIPQLMTKYSKGETYPADRLPGVVDRLIDTKLQLHYVTQVWPGTMNLMVYLRGFKPEDPLATPNLELARLGYSQAMIGGARILWERLMRLIYFLETGKDPSGKSIRRVFFRELSDWTPRWDLLAEFDEEIQSFDNSYRTPEYHKGSILKRELLGGGVVDINDVLGMTTPVTNGVWQVLLGNVSGQPHGILRLGKRVKQQ
jgi:hypothetical protein